MGDLYPGPWDGTDDGEWADSDWIDDPFDELIRAELMADLGPTENAYATLESLAPSFARAARVQRAQMVLATAAAVAAFFGGVGLAVSLVSGDADGTMAAADQAEADGSDPTGDDPQTPTLEVDVPADEPDRSTSVPTSAQQGDDPAADSEPSTAPDGESGSADAGTNGDQSATTAGQSPQATETTDRATSAAPTTTRPTTTRPTTSRPSTTRPTTTRQTTSTTLGPGESRLETDCGSVIVHVDDDSIDLVEVEADPGYRTDVKATGPTEIEVSFERTGSQCELSAKARNGEVILDDD